MRTERRNDCIRLDVTIYVRRGLKTLAAHLQQLDMHALNQKRLCFASVFFESGNHMLIHNPILDEYIRIQIRTIVA